MRVKNRSDLNEFPDGGRATMVRRYSPALNRRQLDILQSCPYEVPRNLADGDYRAARELATMGLMERDTSASSVFRCTEAGTEVVQRWEAAGHIERLKPL